MDNTDTVTAASTTPISLALIVSPRNMPVTGRPLTILSAPSALENSIFTKRNTPMTHGIVETHDRSSIIDHLSRSAPNGRRKKYATTQLNTIQAAAKAVSDQRTIPLRNAPYWISVRRKNLISSVNTTMNRMIPARAFPIMVRPPMS